MDEIDPRLRGASRNLKIALASAGLSFARLEEFAKRTQHETLMLHGFGLVTVQEMEGILEANGLSFRCPTSQEQ